MNLPLENKLALVTGSSRGIGAAIAKRLAADGATVLVHYSASPDRAKNVANEIRKAGGNAEILAADLSRLDGPSTLLAQIDETFAGRFAGRLDILVNNAGTVDFHPILEVTDEAFEKQLNLNVRAIFYLTREAARRMTKAGWGRVINIGSAYGEAVPRAGVGVYAGTKFAVQGFTRGWSRELGASGVTVNNVQPGPIDTELSPADGPRAETLKRLTSVGRFGKVEEIASAVAFLASPHSAFINGESLTVDGGWNA
jgi:3-oxoacyl-[acyl-carrier protein] reductase